MTNRRVRLGLAIGALVMAACAGGGWARLREAHAASDPVLAAIRAARVLGAINRGQATSYRTTYMNAERDVGRLSGVRAHELGSALGVVRGIAGRGSLTASRMRAVFLTLHRNVGWWSANGPPTAGSGGEPTVSQRQCNPPLPAARDTDSRRRTAGLGAGAGNPSARAASMTFPGSGVVFEYYPGLGLQLQVNATFSTAESMLQYGSQRDAEQAGTILEQMIPLASRRAGLLTWEYEFPFEGAEPPWTSGLSQATAIDAFVRAAKRLDRPDFLKVALRLARLFTAPPPVGVRVHLSAGDWFLLYSFDPGQLVLNADLDSLIALHELRVATHSRWVTALVHNGLHSLEHYLPRFNTGSWSYYSLGGPLTDLNYHILNQELAQELCQMTGLREICRTARSFNRELNKRCPIVKQSGDAASGASSRATAASSPPSTVTAGRITRRPGTLAPGSRVRAGSVTGQRVFTGAKRGFALASVGQADYPVTTDDRGKTWKTDGPALHLHAAQAPLGVAFIGAAGRRTVFAWGGGQVIDSTGNGGNSWYSALFTDGGPIAVVPNLGGGLLAFVGAFNGPSVWEYVSTDGGRTWRYKLTVGK